MSHITHRHSAKPRILELSEHTPQRFSPAEIIPEDGERLWREYHHFVGVEFPSPATAGNWQFTPRGYVGYIPLSPSLHFWLRPKVPVANLFRMVEYAYDLSVEFGEDPFLCDSIEEFYESLAVVLSRRIITQERHGFYQDYLSRRQNLPYVRGRLDAGMLMKHPSVATLPCCYRASTVDNEDNQILLSTLNTILHTACCTRRSRALVRQAYHALEGCVTLRSFTPDACIHRTYHRLNAKYKPLHSLCRFFLEGRGPHHEKGNNPMLPFVLNMELLFEHFIARWLQKKLPENKKLRIQERVAIGREKSFEFRIDLVISDAKSRKAQFVLDTKYKAQKLSSPLPHDGTFEAQPSAEDVAQVVAYAEAKQCSQAFLIYPVNIEKNLDVRVGRVRVRTVGFDLKGSLEQSGESVLRQILGN
ncbi:MAG TPA: hypothetical protein VF681_07200 [Abditibacteriaceae bacterium]|jgi:5-methylcytosine-specific restriction enzyme subunit McrC